MLHQGPHIGWTLPHSPLRRDDPAMDVAEVERWYASYVADYAAVVRGDIDDARHLLSYYTLPILFSSDAGSMVLGDEMQLMALAQQQMDGLRSAGYDRSEELNAETTVLNRSCALHRGRLARLRADGTEIAQVEATYLIIEGQQGRQIAAVIAHTDQTADAEAAAGDG